MYLSLLDIHSLVSHWLLFGHWCSSIELCHLATYATPRCCIANYLRMWLKLKLLLPHAPPGLKLNRFVTQSFWTPWPSMALPCHLATHLSRGCKMQTTYEGGWNLCCTDLLLSAAMSQCFGNLVFNPFIFQPMPHDIPLSYLCTDVFNLLYKERVGAFPKSAFRRQLAKRKKRKTEVILRERKNPN